jgi:NAD(P)-dependent dehydrogenase (short-subunit alcohol dehydrogenase family)
MDTLAGKVAVVTGGASGMGRSMALELARRGGAIVIADVNESRLADVVAEIGALGRDVLGVRCDVRRDDDMEGLRDAAFARFGVVDVLCNNAGVSLHGPPHTMEMADWDWQLQTNTLGPVRGVRMFVPAMVERGNGHVVNTASIAGTWAHNWDSTAYVASKFAVYGFSESLARALRPLGVGVSVLCPGAVKTNIAETVRFSGIEPGREQEYFWFPPELMDLISPDLVGPMVCDAIEADRFLVFTHERDAEHFRTWRLDIEQSLADAIARQEPPPRL